LLCAAQHIFWSSIYGSVLGDDGRFDAFETTLEILRMKLEYPGLPPQEYADKDAAFHAFMDCQTGVLLTEIPVKTFYVLQVMSMCVLINNFIHLLIFFRICDVDATDPEDKDNVQELCSYSKLKSAAYPCEQCRRGPISRFMLPGGAMCCHKQDKLAECPRLWE
jgi:hypothetical protein